MTRGYHRRPSVSLFMLSVVVLVCSAHAAEYEARTFAGPAGKTLPYRLLKPHDYKKGTRYPLVMLLHGFGERGTDNEKPIKAASSGASMFLKTEVREKYPCFVVVPQSAGPWVSEPDFKVTTPFRQQPQDSVLLAALTIGALEREFSVDPDRIYIMGYSNGGCGVWDMLVRGPKLFAAAVVISGAGDPAWIGVAKLVPIWVFHGAKDTTVPVERGHDMVHALERAGGHPIYTEYPTGTHSSSPKSAHQEPDLLPWLFAQRRGKPMVAAASAKAKSSSAKPDQASDKRPETSKGWQSLFDGRTLTGWKDSWDAKAWSVDDGMIVANGTRSMLYYTAETYRDFELKASVKYDSGTNSGIFFRAGYSEGKWPSGFEVQLNGAKEGQPTGSLYNIVKVEKRLVAPDAWFAIQIIAQGKQIIVKLNDQTVVNADDDRHDGKLIGLQSNGGIVRFKNITIKRM